MSDSPGSTLQEPVAPPRPSGHQRATVLATRTEGRDALRLDVEVEGPWLHRPGQVAELATAAGEEGFFAIASPPACGHRLTFLVRAGGTLSEPLMSLRVGESLLVRGPHGRGYELDRADSPSAPLLLVGVGSALSALRSALLDALASGARPVTLVLGVRTAQDLAFADELPGWLARSVRVVLVESRRLDPTGPQVHPAGGTVLAGHVQDHLGPIAATLPGALALLAGSEEFEDEVTEVLVRAGVAHHRIQRNFRPDGRTG